MRSFLNVFRKSTAKNNDTPQTNPQSCLTNDTGLISPTLLTELPSHELKTEKNSTHRIASSHFVKAKQNEEYTNMLYVVNFARIFKELRFSSQPPTDIIIQILIKNSKYMREIAQIIFLLDTHRLPLTEKLILFITQHGQYAKKISNGILALKDEVLVAEIITEKLLIEAIKQIAKNSASQDINKYSHPHNEMKTGSLALKQSSRFSQFSFPRPPVDTIEPKYNITFTEEKSRVERKI